MKKVIEKMKIVRLKDKINTCKYSSEPYYDRFDEALKGVEEQKFFIIGAEPGSGKSLGLYQYVRRYLNGGLLPADTGIVIFVSTRDEIHSFIKGAKLAGDEFAVVTAKGPMEDAKEFGGLSDATKAPVVLVTAQYLYARCPDKFADFERLLYRGKPRALRLWDEGFCKASSALVPMDSLSEIKGTLRRSHSALIAAVEEIEFKVRDVGVGGEITIPAAIKSLAIGADEVLTPKSHVEALRDLVSLAGKVARVCKGWNGARYLSGEVKQLPDDLAPLFTFDASARVSPVYEIMADAGVAIERLPVGDLSYCNATFHHMKLAAGRMTMAAPAKRVHILAEVAEHLNADPDDRYLIIYNRIDGTDLPQELRDATVNPGRFEFMYWGNHRASNDYRDIKKVICIGLLNYSEYGYDEKHIKCLGQTISRAHDLERLRHGESQSQLLQALTRSNLRQHSLGICGKCDIYLIAKDKDVEEHLKQAFPACRYQAWKPSCQPLCGRVADIFNTTIDQLDKISGTSVRKTVIYKLLGISRNQFANLIKEPKLVAAFRKVGISVGRTTLERTAYSP